MAAARRSARSARAKAPLNIYGYSKFLFDQYVRGVLPERTAQIAGFRYFNVYGPREQHKGTDGVGRVSLLPPVSQRGPRAAVRGSAGYAAGEQRRDFVSVEDVVKVESRLPRSPRAQRHLQPRHRQRGDVQRGRARDDQRCAQGAAGEPDARAPRSRGRRRNRLHPVPARARRQVPELHAGRSRAASRLRAIGHRCSRCPKESRVTSNG